MAAGLVKRRLDWPERLADALDAAGTFSESYFCVQFVADVVKAMTDEDPLPERAGWADIQDAWSWLTANHLNVLDALAARFPSIPVALAQRGDVIYRLTDDDGIALGICIGQMSAFVSDDGKGLAFWPTLDQRAAFKVG